jgi:hypothetical protein
VVVDVSFSSVFLGLVLMGDVDVLDLRVVVLMGVGGQEMHPVLASMEVVRDVEMLVAVVEGVVVMASSWLCVHRPSIQWLSFLLYAALPRPAEAVVAPVERQLRPRQESRSEGRIPHR